jgi:hypothetical protein
MSPRLIALGHPVHKEQIDLAPFGERASFVDATREPSWLRAYQQANDEAFAAGALGLPGWVLVDLYVMPTVIGMLVEEEQILAAYVAVPTIAPGVFMGCSLLSRAPGSGLAARVKVLTLRMLKARAQRGITQISSRSVGVHARVGPLRIEGRAPELHERSSESFVYSIDLSNDAAWDRARRGDRVGPNDDEELHARDASSLTTLVDRVSRGEALWITGVTDDHERLRVSKTADVSSKTAG